MFRIRPRSLAVTSGWKRKPYEFPSLITCLLLVALLPGCVSGRSVTANNDDEEPVTTSHCEPATGPTAEIVTAAGGAAAYGIDTALRRHDADPA